MKQKNSVLSPGEYLQVLVCLRRVKCEGTLKKAFTAWSIWVVKGSVCLSLLLVCPIAAAGFFTQFSLSSFTHNSCIKPGDEQYYVPELEMFSIACKALLLSQSQNI